MNSSRVGARHKMQAGSPGPAINRPQSGVALAIVVWFIAGMSLLVAGIVSHARVDTRMAQLHVARAKVSGAGDGATNLLMAELVAGKLSRAVLQGVQAGSYRVGDIDVAVTLVSTSGLIDLNRAPAGMLAALFAVAGGLDETEAQRLAGNVVDWRRLASKQRGIKYGSSKFTEIEDLLRVEGVNRTLFDALRGYIVADSASSGAMNWSQAPQQLLAVLEKLDSRQHGALLQRKESLASPAADESEAGVRGGGTYRVDALVKYGGRAWLRRRWVAGESAGESLLPWLILRTEPPRVVDG
ncbi:MAG: general secretion pathway protein GspK [Gammaproteobacteria bacterium]|nr:MAG: general secretion pathway protein GspK [Gammaproteobacteria bacterium]RLA60209.1 MAG: general secretion pathway protein GspK [Gammaproteobacteria bacterium]